MFSSDRSYWVDVATRIARPVLEALGANQLRRTMPVEYSPGLPPDNDRRDFSHLEALARTLMGLAPWLELDALIDPGEEDARQDLLLAARASIRNGTDPSSPDFLNFSRGGQPVVDAAFLAQAFIRAPKQLWAALDGRTRKNAIAALKSTRILKPCFNNWLLFSAIIEAFLLSIGEDADLMRIDYAIRQHEQWFKGDGVYGDGPDFHWDYYNSFVIQPMLVDVLTTAGKHVGDWKEFDERIFQRARTYAAILERFISPEGTFPPLGRSLAYRFGALQLLSQMVLLGKLPATLKPGQVRAALTAVIRRMIEAPGAFDANGWLTIGFCGHQPAVAEPYISTGSLYLCSAVLLPLGLPSSDAFWSAPAVPWTSQKYWSGARDLPGK